MPASVRRCGRRNTANTLSGPVPCPRPASAHGDVFGHLYPARTGVFTCRIVPKTGCSTSITVPRSCNSGSLSASDRLCTRRAGNFPGEQLRSTRRCSCAGNAPASVERLYPGSACVLERGESWIVRHFGVAEGFAQQLPELLFAAKDSDVAVARLKRLHRDQRLVRRSGVARGSKPRFRFQIARYVSIE